jgi:asparagine synthase (glutamine-hydrolysing)
MCGFAGIFNSPDRLTFDQCNILAQKVSFRGPDNCSIRFYDQELCPGQSGPNMFFFNRLAIMDLDKRSNQPFEDSRYSLVFNGEIYNFRELRSILEKKGYLFQTTSDTEVLFYALQAWGLEALEKLNGMFAFCWLDRKEKRFTLVRDRFGIKPLYYWQRGSSLIFGSELDSVLRLAPQFAEIDCQSVNMYLWMQFIPTPFTMVKGALKLPPGHFLKGTFQEINEKKHLKSQPFWEAYSFTVQETMGNVSQNLEEVLTESLSRQLIADVPLGLFLSSGVDSSLLAALVNKHFSRAGEFNFFSVAFSEDTISDESKDALSFIKGFNNPSLKSHTLTINSELVGDLLDKLYEYFDEPTGDSASLLNWAISRKARERVKVTLSGDGGDELFWGYTRYRLWQKPTFHYHGKNSLPTWLSVLLRQIPLGAYWKIKGDLELEPDPLRRHFAIFLTPIFRDLMNKPIWEQPIWAMVKSETLGHRKDLCSWLDLKTYLPDAMLQKVDRAGMASGLEVRVPYLDNAVADYALSLPFGIKSDKEFSSKAPLKRLLKQLAPHYDVSRPKKGFNFPLDAWLRGQWREKVLSTINKASLNELDMDEKKYLEIVKRFYDGDRRYCNAVWYMFNLVLWHQKFKKIITS